MLSKFHKKLNELYYTKLKAIIEKPENQSDIKKENLYYFLFKNLYIRFAQILIIIIMCLSRILSPILYIFDFIISIFYKLYYFQKYYSIKNLNHNQSKMKIILDLDNTLVYKSSRKIQNLRYFSLNDGSYVYIRPFTNRFLNSLSQICDFFIYTSATEEYASQIINYIDNNKCIQKKLCRKDCIYSNGKYLKDIKKLNLKKNDNDRIIIIDDSPNCYLNFHDHIIEICYWEGDPRDDSLIRIQNILYSNYIAGGFFYNVILDSKLMEIENFIS